MSKPCPDCKGTGKIQMLNSVRECGCAAVARAAPDALTVGQVIDLLFQESRRHQLEISAILFNQRAMRVVWVKGSGKSALEYAHEIELMWLGDLQYTAGFIADLTAKVKKAFG
jgi:hypothetical protein